MKKISKPRCVLLDACIIIEAHALGVWESLIEKVEIVVSSIVAHEEALFYIKGELPSALDLQTLIIEGKIKEIEATAPEMASLIGNFDASFADVLHPGEIEALALIQLQKTGDAMYCSCDGFALKALAMLGHAEKGISMEALLQSIGRSKNVKSQFSEKFFQEKIAQGQSNRVTRTGLKSKNLV